MTKTFKSLLMCGLVLAAICVCPTKAYSQWRVGVSGGADYNWYLINKQYQTDFHYDGAWGWSAALFTQYNFLPWVGLRAELEATSRNYRFYRTAEFQKTDYTNYNTYLQVPVMVQFSIGEENNSDGRGYRVRSFKGSVRGFVNLGVYGGCWVAGQQKGTFYDSMNGKVLPVDGAYAFQAEKDQRGDFGLAGGLGIEYHFLRHWSMHIEGRCYYSFISTVKPYMRVKDNRYNTTLGVNLGFAYMF